MRLAHRSSIARLGGALTLLAGCSSEGTPTARDAADVTADATADATAEDIAEDITTDIAVADVTEDAGSTSASVRLLAPLSGAVLGGDQPTLRWEALSEPGVSTTVQVCVERSCARPVAEQTVTGGSARLSSPLPAGRYYWRARRERGAFSATWRFAVPAGARPHSGSTVGSTGDLDGDGRDDLTVLWNIPGYLGDATPLGLRLGAGLAELHGTPEGFGPVRWVPIARGSVPVPPTVMAGDADGDGYTDQIVGLRDRPELARLDQLAGSAVGLISTPVHYMLATYYSAVAAVGDLNGDGYGDAVFTLNYMAASGGGVWWMRGSAAGFLAPVRFATPFISRSGMVTGSLATGDFNGDDLGDVVVCGTEGDPCRVFAGGAAGPPGAPTLELPPTMAHDGYGARATSAGDVNGDGFADLIISAYETRRPQLTSLYFGSATGLPAAASRVMEDCSGCFPPPFIAVGDVTGDGVDDLVRGDDFSMLQLFPGGPDVLTAAPRSLPILGAPMPLRRDFNGDGYGDLVVRRDNDLGQSVFEVFLGGASGFRSVATFRFGKATDRPAPVDVGLAPARPAIRLAARRASRA